MKECEIVSTEHEVEITMRMTVAHKHALTQALELMARIGMGQFNEIAGVFGIEDESSTLHERRVAVEQACKRVLMPDMLFGGYYGIHNEKTPMVSKRAWELLQAIQKHSRQAQISGDPLPEVVR